MKSKFSIVVTICVVGFLWSCKTASGPGDNNNNNNGTTPASIGDTIPGKNTLYTFDFDLLTIKGEIVSGYPTPDHSTYVDTTGLSIFDKTNVFLVIDDANDTSYFYYESNGDVSVYFLNPGYYQIYGNPRAPVNEPLQQIDKKVFSRWITLPIASKSKNQVFFDSSDVPITISAGTRAADIHATVDYIADSTVTVSGKVLGAKICRITITADKIKTQVQGNTISSLTHTRTFWFVPKIGYFAKLETRTDMQEYTVDEIPRDTSAVLKVLTSYHLY